jgi:hypothetical protein
VAGIRSATSKVATNVATKVANTAEKPADKTTADLWTRPATGARPDGRGPRLGGFSGPGRRRVGSSTQWI